MESILELRREVRAWEKDREAIAVARVLEREDVFKDAQLGFKENRVALAIKQVSLKVEILANELLLLQNGMGMSLTNVPYSLPTLRKKPAGFKSKVDSLRKELESIRNQASDVDSRGRSSSSKREFDDGLRAQLTSFTERVGVLVAEYNESRKREESGEPTASSPADAECFKTFLKDYKAVLAQLGHMNLTRQKSKPSASHDEPQEDLGGPSSVQSSK